MSAAPDNTAPVTFATYGSGPAFEYSSIDEAFPNVEPGRKPLGVNILVQIRQPKTVTKGGILLAPADRSTEYYNTRVAKVIAIGPLCFKSTMEATDQNGAPALVHVDWPEGAWFDVGDFVEVPQYGGQRFTALGMVNHPIRDFENGGVWTTSPVEEEVTFSFFKAKDIIAKITGDPLTIRAYAD